MTSPPRRYITITKPRSASLCSAIKIYKEKSCIKPYRSSPLIIGDENCYAKNSGLTLPHDVMQNLYFFQVLISNGALNSSATEVSSTTWPLPPTPVVTGYTNTSFSVTVPLNQMHFPALCEINIEVCARAYT